MAKVRMRNRISAILLSSDEPLTCQAIHERYPGRNLPNTRAITGVLQSYPEFLEVGSVTVPRKSGPGHMPASLWTHIDHALLSSMEEE